MGALKIDCYCNETQMEKIISMVTKHLNESDRTEVSDFDDVIGDVRVCAEFESYMDSVVLKAAEVLDDDWDLLDEDSAVLSSRLRAVLEEYNRNDKEVLYQAHHILKDRLF
ncbi:hypothetical protein JGH11_16800 [Dysgonomonas sp. Marseille-P4677]|uniref:hypothetical protein n=1 Tax=Dysgonomonas sp. Marseille-P4677 TaxID=2364790 RepID=UPI0019115D9A|nr:hypothetical protein [Dysgonomonas sp. Marseille-P4677]MBK5722535.1 hypothetical protein [Dysgonomonas sp. Marseille-P4677]